MSDNNLGIQDELQTQGAGREHHRKPAITPTLVIGLGGTGVSAVRYLKRRLVWLWHREAIEKELSQVPANFTPEAWRRDVWQRYEMEGGLPLIQVLGVDTWPWGNRPGQVYLNEHEYVYLGGYNATTVLDTIRLHRLDPERYPNDHPEIAEWWHWYENNHRPGQIHSGARQIRAIGRLSFYRRYREFWRKVRPQIDLISSIQGRQDVEDRGYEVSPPGASKRIYIISSICGGTGAGTFLDVVASLRAHFLESAIITGIFALPSVFIPDLQSDLQKERVQANAYAALKEITYFQSNSLRLRLPGEAAVEVSGLFNRLYLLERTNQAGESLNSIDDITHLIANQVFLEGLTHVGSRIWEYDVNVTMERRQRNGREIGYIYSSFANSTLGVPRDEMLEFAELRYTDSLLKALLRENVDSDGRFQSALLPDVLSQIQVDARQAFHSLEVLVSGRDAGAGAGFDLEFGEGDFFPEDEAPAAAPLEAAEPRRKTAPIEQFQQELERILQTYGFSGAEIFLKRINELLAPRLEQVRSEAVHGENEQDRAEQRLRDMRARRPFLANFNIWPISLLLQGFVRQYQANIHEQEAAIERLHGNLEEAIKQRNQWMSLYEKLDPLRKSLEERASLLRRLVQNELAQDFKRLQSVQENEQRPYEMFTQILGQQYVADVLYPEARASGLGRQLGQDSLALLSNSHIFQINRNTTLQVVAGTNEQKEVLELAPVDSHKLYTAVRAAAYRSVRDYLHRSNLSVRTILESNLTNIQVRLRDLFARCQPFWRYNSDRGGFDETQLEQIVFAGVQDAEDRAWRYLLRDFPEFKLVETDDPARIEACRVAHGLPIEYLEALPQMKEKYDRFVQDQTGPMQLNALWEPRGQDPLPELIGEPPLYNNNAAATEQAPTPSPSEEPGSSQRLPVGEPEPAAPEDSLPGW